jgi:hypothetical protein
MVFISNLPNSKTTGVVYDSSRGEWTITGCHRDASHHGTVDKLFIYSTLILILIVHEISAV